MAEKHHPHIIQNNNYILGIGASAGGLDAINQLFENMPDNTGFSFVIVQHISPDHKSLMAELVSKHTRMPVVEAEDEMPVKPNHIYVIPSRKFMTIQSGKLRLSDKNKNQFPNNAIDVFFDSLASDAGEKAIGIILSGTGTDGTKGSKAIKSKGGLIVVQDPATAAFDGMPNSVLGTNICDLVSPPEIMAQELDQLLSDTPQMKTFQQANSSEESYVNELLYEIKEKTGQDFTYYKRPTILRRIAKRLSELNIGSLKKYLDYASDHPEEFSVISKEFLINVSNFFRDKEAFDILKNKIIPSILNHKNSETGVKAWCVGCSTGEEAYSLAILFREWLEKSNSPQIPIKIFATDVDRDALEVANRGVYPKSIMQDIPGDRLAKYFLPEGNAYRIHPDIRKTVVFSYHDILKDPPFGRMDLISCRNMLIYIKPEQQKEIQQKFHFALNLEGYLFLGPSENIGLMKNVMEEIDRKWKIFKCISKNRLEDYKSFFVPLEKRLQTTPPVKQKNPLNHLSELFTETLLEGHNMAGLFITRDYEVKQAVGNYKNFINFPESGFNFNLLKMVGPELSVALSVAVGQAMRDNKVIFSNNVKVSKDNSNLLINITVKPFNETKTYQLPFLFVTLEQLKETDVTATKIFQGTSIEELDRVNELEQELRDSKSSMQLLLEEVETRNEELQSINEEAVSTNEELQSTNEELQSLNEELHTVSAEHQMKIRELMELNDDLNNYFNNSNIGQILVDRDLIVRRFTPSVGRMISLIESDLNRSIADITTKIKNVDLISSIRSVIKTGVSIEKEILLNDDAFFLMRLNPYIRRDNSIDGVVINFIDISELKMLNSIVQAIFESAPYGISAKKAIRNERNEIIDFEYMAINAACEKLYGVPVGTLKGSRLRSFKNFREEFFDGYKKVVNSGEPLHYESYESRLDKWLDVNVVKMMDGVVTTHVDITEIKKANKIIEQSYENLKATSGKLAEMNTQLEQSNLDLMQFASIASHDLKEPLRKIETFGNLLNEKLRSKLDEKELRYVEKIVKASGRMQVLVEDVLTFSKLSNSELPLEPVDLNKILNRIVDDLEITIREKNAQIVIGNLPELKAVKGQMHQLFQNLISNALKFNDKPIPVISIHPEQLSGRKVAELKIDPSKYVCIVVKDNGIGIEKQYQEKIFGIFQRLNGNRYDGTGIGLAVCKKIVEKNRGFLLLESRPGEGTAFYIILPIMTR